MKPSTPNSSRWHARALVACFFLCLGVPLLDFFFHIDPTSLPSENRLLAPLPPRPDGVGGLKQSFAGWDAYFTDHFGGRKALVMWHKKLKWSLYHEKKLHEDVLVGNDGWLFFSGAQMVEHARGALQFSPPELENWRKLLQRRRDWLAARGIKYLFVVAPDKQSIYPEFLPAWLQPLVKDSHTKLDQLIGYLRDHSTVEILDLRPELRAAKKLGPLYQMTDSHWNEVGAFVACEAVVRALAAKQLPGLEPLSLEAFHRSNQVAPGGDLMRYLGVSLTESNAFSLTPKPELPALEIFIPAGEHTQDRSYAKNPQGHGRAIIYHDSFGRYWVPFLGYQFSEANFYWKRYFDPVEIERQKPVVVINEMVERGFDVADPIELSARDALP